MTGEDGPHDSVGQGAAPPRLTVKITWALAGRVTEPGRYIFTFGWQTRTAKALIAWNSQTGLQERPDVRTTHVGRRLSHQRTCRHGRIGHKQIFVAKPGPHWTGARYCGVKSPKGG